MTEEEKKIISQIKDVAQYRTIIQHGDGHGTIAFIPRLEQTMVINNYTAKVVYDLIEKQQKEIENIEEYVNSPEFLDWHLGFTTLDELEYRKNNINKLLEEK